MSKATFEQFIVEQPLAASRVAVNGTIEILTPTSLTGWIALPELNADDLSIIGEKIKSAVFFDRPDVVAETGKAAQGFTIELEGEISMVNFFNPILKWKFQRILTPAPIFSMLQYKDWEKQYEDNPEHVYSLVTNSCFFQPEFYIKQTDFDEASKIELLIHYLTEGWLIGLNPHPLFSTNYYLKQHRDVAQKGFNPLLHFVFSGTEENRETSPDFDAQFYHEAYSDQIPGGISPLQHYICVGYQNGLMPVPWIDQKMVHELSRNNPQPISLASQYRQYYAEFDYPHELIGRVAIEKETATAPNKTGVDIIVPFYREPYLIKLCIAALVNIAEELNAHNCKVIAILDSPEDDESVEAFRFYTSAAKKSIPLEAIENELNVGFVSTVNKGLRKTISSGRHALLLNSDCFMAAGTLTEMMRVLTTDPMIGFVNPRSNNATIATFPKIVSDIGVHFDAFKQISSRLPAVAYVPTCVGFCMLISDQILANFGLLDVSYGSGYNEENDYVSRANRVGFRAVQANHAYALHIGGTSFRHTDFNSHSNSGILTDRYPEYQKQVKSYWENRAYALEETVSGFIPGNSGKLKILLDISQIGGHPNGTSVMALNLIKQFSLNTSKFEWHVITNTAADNFHKISSIPGVTVHYSWTELNESKAKFAHAFRLGQPFRKTDLTSVMGVSATTSFFMLDTIAYDCGYISNMEIQDTWEALAAIADGFAYQSNFTKNQFDTRFPDMAEKPNLVSYHSLDLNEYIISDDVPFSDMDFGKSPPGLKGILSEDYVLIVGNHFSHKDVLATYNQFISAHPEAPVVVIGDYEMQDKSLPSHCTVFLKSGEIDNAIINKIYKTASAVIFPSFYEGFGLPILDSLANGRPLFLRDNVINREIVSAICEKEIPSGVIFYANHRDLIKKFPENIAVKRYTPIRQTSPQTWSKSAIELIDFFDSIISNWTINRALLRHVFISQKK